MLPKALHGRAVGASSSSSSSARRAPIDAVTSAAPSASVRTPRALVATGASLNSSSSSAPLAAAAAAASAAAPTCGARAPPPPPPRAHTNRRSRPIARAAAPAADNAQEGSSPAAPSSTTRGAGRMTYYPSSYAELVGDAAASVAAAMADGLRRVEVEFPPVPTGLDAYKGSSDLFIDSNVQLALTAAKMLAGLTPLPAGAPASSAAPSPDGRRVHIVVPDLGEYARSYKLFRPAIEALGGGRITMGHLKEAEAGGGVNPFDLIAAASAALAGASAAPDPAPAGAAADVLIVVNATCGDLPALEAYAAARGIRRNEETRPGAAGAGAAAGADGAAANSNGNGPTLVLWNLELDTLRGDLGLLGYPPKALHHRFLATVRPAFFLRARDYSKSVPVAPFIVNYSGALLREWPGPWQVMLRQDGGEYACIAEDAVRYNLGELKDELTAAMGLDTEAAGSVAALLRRGYKTSTWFEDDAENEQSREWRL
jgi:hypothetical protein